MAQVFTNNATTFLASSLSATATAFTVVSGGGSTFPPVQQGGNDTCQITVESPDGTYEIMTCTGRNSDTFSVVRAQEGTGVSEGVEGFAFPQSSRVELRVTAAIMNKFIQKEGDEIDAGLFNTDTGVKIQSKRSTSPGQVPSNFQLDQGELAVNIEDNTLWVGDAQQTPVMLIQKLVISAATGSVTNPFPGLLHYNDGTQTLSVFVDSVTGWKVVGTPVEGPGVSVDVEHPFRVLVTSGAEAGTVFLETLDNIAQGRTYPPGHPSAGQPVPDTGKGTRAFQFWADHAIHTTDLVVNGISYNKSIVCYENMSLAGIMEFGSAKSAGQGGVLFHNAASDLGGEIRFAAITELPPPDTEGENGDFRFGL